MQDVQLWRSQAKCRVLVPEQSDQLFFIKRGQSVKPAEDYCSRCPVRKECLNYALLYNELGIWAGTSESERREMRKVPGLVDYLKKLAIDDGILEDHDLDNYIVVDKILSSKNVVSDNKSSRTES